MSLTPETLTRHELNGLPARVVDADNPDLVGIAGRVVVETQGTLHVDDGSRVRQVPKRGTAFEFELVGDDGLEFEHDAGTGNDRPAATDEAAGGTRPAATDEAAERRKASGSASERESETPGVRPGKSGSTGDGSRDGDTDIAARDCEDAVYVTVDGATLLSRPAHRTEATGDSRWR